MTLLDGLLADLDVTVANNTPQLDLHPQLHNDTDAILTAVVASLAKSVEWFDADGTIGTDATAAFRLAIANGGIVKLKANTTYTITGTITPDTDNTWIVGDGPSSVIRMVGPAFNLFTVNGVDGFQIRDCSIDGSAIPAPRLGSLSATAANGSSTIALYNTHTLQSGDVVYVNNPDTPWVGYQQVTLSNVTSTSAAVSPAILNPAAGTTGFGANSVVATVTNGQGGHAIRASDCGRLSLRDVVIDGVLRHGLWLVNVADVRVEGCTFQHLGDALVAQDPYSAFNFGIGGYGVSRLKVLGNTFRDIVGRRAAGIELRIKVNQADTPDEADILIEGNHFINLGSTGIARANNGAAINLVCAENSVRFDRIAVNGNTFDRITDGFAWILSPTGSITVQGNVGTNSRHGPFFEVDAPMASIVGNVALGASSTDGYAGIWARCSPGTGDFFTAGQGVDAYGITITGNTIKGMRSAVGVGIYIQGGPQVPAVGPREFVITGNTISECNQDGIQVDMGYGDYTIAHNIIRDVNAGSLAATSLAAPVTFVEGQTATIRVTSSANFTDGMQTNIAADTTNRRVLQVVDDTHILLAECPTGGAASFLAGDAVVNPFPGAAGIYLNGDANVGSVGDTSVSVSDLTGLNWGNGNALSIAGESGLSISGAPTDNGDGTWTVALSGALVLAHQHGETMINTARTNSATFKALHIHQRVDISHNRVRAGRLNTTRYGLSLRNVIGPIQYVHNDFNDCLSGTHTITGYPKLFTYNPLHGGHAGWQTDQSLPQETHLRDWAYRTATASSALTTSAMTAGSTTSFTVNAAPTDWTVGDFLWLEAIVSTVAGGDAVNGEVAKIDTIGAVAGDTTVRVTANLVTLNWTNGNSVSISDGTNTEAFTISGAPVANADGSYTVTLSGALVNSYSNATPTTITNATRGNSAALAGLRIGLHSAVTYGHASGVRVWKAAYNPKLRVWGADSDNTSHGHYATLGYDEFNLLMKLLFSASGHVPPAHARVEVQGTSSNLQLVANNNIVELTAAGEFRPRITNARDLGTIGNAWRNVYVTGGLKLFTKAGAPVDGDFTNPIDGMLALDTTNSKIYVRFGGTWKATAALA